MADLKLGTQIGGNLVWHQGILELNPLDDKIFYKEFDMITDKGGQTINGGLNLKGDVDTTGRYFGKGINSGWGSNSKGAFSQEIENDASAHWLLTSNRKDGSGRAGIQVLTSNTGIMRLYTDNITKYVDIMGGQVSVQATMPSSDSHLTRKDFVDAEVKRSMDYTDALDTRTVASIATLTATTADLTAQTVKITGNQTVAGIKTFSSAPVLPAADPTTATQAAHKSYVDKRVGTAVQSVSATSPVISTGGLTPVISIAPATRASAGSMNSADKIKLDDLPADALSRSGGTMKAGGFIKLDGLGGIQSITAGKEYSIFRDHNNGNVTVGGAGGDLYIGYTTESEAFTTKNVILHQKMMWKTAAAGSTILVDTDGFIPWSTIKDVAGLEGKTKKLSGGINFDTYEGLGFYNLYAIRPATGTQSVNPPPFDYGTMIVVGADKDVNNFVTQIATERTSGVTYIRTRNDGTMAWSTWNKQYSEKSKPTIAEINAAPAGYGLGTLTARSLSNKSCNDVDGIGFYGIYDATTDTPYGTGPSGSTLIHSQWGTGDGGVSSQIFVSYISDRMHIRRQYKGVWQPWVEVYTEGHKPTPAEVGSVNLIGDTMTGSLTIKYGAPTMSFVETDNTDKKWLLAADGGTFRIHEDNTSITDASVVLMVNTSKQTEIRNPVARGVQGTGASALTRKDYVDTKVAKAGDTMTGALNAPSFIQTAAQSTNVASSARKDYVDAIDAKNVAKAGDTMTGALRWNNVDTYVNGAGANLYVAANTAGGRVYIEGAANPIARVAKTDYEFYHRGNRPTPEEIKAVPIVYLTTEDLNTIIATGVYEQHGNVNTPGNNYPENLAGSLTVTNGAGPKQSYHVYNSSRVYTRAQYSTGGFTAWALTYNSLNKPTAAAIDAVDIDRVNFAQIGTWAGVVNKIPYVGSNGVLEVGKYIDFHDTNSTADYTVRLNTGPSDLSITTPNGTIQIGAQNATYAHIYTDRSSFYMNKEMYVNGSLVLHDGSSSGTLTLDNWIRTTGESGLFCATYGGGIHMRDATWVRTYNDKKFFVSNAAGDAIYTAGGVKADKGVYDAGNRCYSASNPVPAGAHTHVNTRARSAVQLWTGDLGQGNFALSRPWSDFDYMMVCVLWDDGGGMSTKVFSRYEIEVAQSIGINYDISGGAGGLQWMGRFAADNKTFATSYENGRLRYIVGFDVGTVN